MKIALIRQKVHPYGGAEGVVHRLAKELVARGQEVHVLAADWEEPVAGVQYHRMAVAKGASWLKVLSFQRSVRRFLAAHTMDIVHGFDKTWPVDIYRAGDGSHRSWLRRFGAELPFFKRLLLWADPKNLILLRMEKRILRDPGLKQVIANSALVRDDLMRDYALPKEKITVLHNGVDVSRFKPASEEQKRANKKSLGIAAQSTVLLFVGSNFTRKGLRYAVQALIGNNDRDIFLLVAGKGKEATYRRMAETGGVENKIKFLGAVKDTLPLYQAADLFVLPTLYDPFSNVCLEAMACGLPVITTPDNGASEIMEEGKTGWVTPTVRTSAAVSAALRCDIASMGAAAAATARHYSFSGMSENILRIYRDIP